MNQLYFEKLQREFNIVKRRVFKISSLIQSNSFKKLDKVSKEIINDELNILKKYLHIINTKLTLTKGDIT